MRVLFLDFDGVLHPVSALQWFAMGLPTNEVIRRGKLFRWTWVLDELLEPHSDVRIVVHSSWRLLHDDALMPMFLGPLGDCYAGITFGAGRWEGIDMVVQQNGLVDYRILDDHPEEFPAGLSELITCDSELGVYDKAVQHQILAWLQR